MAPTCRRRESAPVTVPIEGQDWYSFVNLEGRERFVCMVQPCPAQSDYCRKDALNRHLVAEHQQKTLRKQSVQRRCRGRKRGNMAAPRADGHPSGRSIGIHHDGDSAFKRIGQSSMLTTPSSSRPPKLLPPSTVPGILRRAGRNAPEPLPSQQQSGEGYGNPTYAAVHRQNKLKLSRRKAVRLQSSPTPIPESQFVSDDDDAAKDSPRSPPPLSPIEVTLYSPRQLKVSGYKNVFQTVCLPDVGSPFDQFYRDCEPPTSGKSSRGSYANRPIRIGVSPQKGLASGIPREGTLNVRWEDGGKTTFWIPLQKKKGKAKFAADMNDSPVLQGETGHVGESSGGLGSELNYGSPVLKLPTVSQLLSDLHVGTQDNAENGSLCPIHAAEAPNSIGGDDERESDVPFQDGHGPFSASQMPSLSQLPTLSQISLPPLEDEAEVPDCGEITSQQLVDYASDSVAESEEL